MDGRDPSGQKVGLLDEHHFMAYLCDPAGHEWRSKFKIQTELAPLMRKMINMYVPLDRDGLPTSRKRVLKEFRVSTVCVMLEIALSFSFIICHETNEHRNFIPSRVNGCTSLKILFQVLSQERATQTKQSSPSKMCRSRWISMTRFKAACNSLRHMLQTQSFT